MRSIGGLIWNGVLPGHVPSDHARIEKALPPELRGRVGYQRILEDIPIRISVSGTRGKTGLTRLVERLLRDRGARVYAKVTGTEPRSILDGVEYPVVRPRPYRALLEENIWELKRYYRSDLDAVVLENQAISEYTMRIFNRDFCRATHVLMPNVRMDHADTIAPTLQGLAAAFGRSVKGGTVVSGEPRPEVADVVRRQCEGLGARFVDAAPDRSRPQPPGFESATVASALLQELFGRGLPASELEEMRGELAAGFAWRRSALDGVLWFNGAAINDIDSTDAIFRHLQLADPQPTSMIAYFRPDRRGRTASFIEYLDGLLGQGAIERLYLAGHDAGQVARRLGKHGAALRTYPDDEHGVAQLVRDVAVDCCDEAVMTVVNAVAPFARAVVAALAGRDHRLE